MKDFLVNRKKEIILVSILLVFAVILVIVIINKDKIGNIQGIKLDEDIIFCENNYIINNTYR